MKISQDKKDRRFLSKFLLFYIHHFQSRYLRQTSPGKLQGTKNSLRKFFLNSRKKTLLSLSKLIQKVSLFLEGLNGVCPIKFMRFINLNNDFI